jgi:hypothetical protein
MDGRVSRWSVRGTLLVAMWLVGLPWAAWGQAFGPTRNLSGTPAFRSDEVQVATYQGNVYVVWADEITGDGDIYFRRSTDFGNTFGAALRLSFGAGFAGDPRVLANGNDVYVAWAEDGIHLRVSHDQGASFGPVVTLGDGSNPRLAASGVHVYVAWENSIEDEIGDVLFRASHDSGTTFGPLMDINGSGGYGDVEIAARGADVYLVWDDYGTNDGSDIFFRKSGNYGVTFGSTQKLVTGNDYNSRHARLAVSGPTVLVVWSECPFFGSNCEVVLRRSLDRGVTFQPLQNVSNNAGRSDRPELYVRGTRVYLAWVDGSPFTTDIFYAQSMDGGVSFMGPFNLSASAAHSLTPRLSRAGSGVRVVWTEGSFESRDVFTRATVGYGPAFGPVENLSASPGDSQEPAIASSQCGGRVHVLWPDESPGVSEIFYRRGDFLYPFLFCILDP